MKTEHTKNRTRKASWDSLGGSVLIRIWRLWIHSCWFSSCFSQLRCTHASSGISDGDRKLSIGLQCRNHGFSGNVFSGPVKHKGPFACASPWSWRLCSLCPRWKLRRRLLFPGSCACCLNVCPLAPSSVGVLTFAPLSTVAFGWWFLTFTRCGHLSLCASSLHIAGRSSLLSVSSRTACWLSVSWNKTASHFLLLLGDFSCSQDTFPPRD